MKKLNIGLLGFGTVGKGVQSVLNHSENMTLHAIFRRSGKATETGMVDTIEDLINNPKIDTIVEAMGGLEPAFSYLKQALLSEKNVVTSNKALVNAYGDELNRLAIQHNVSFLFSAACGGGIPFLPTLIQIKQREPIVAVGGILNGTTNFIIDKMERDALGFDEALKQAQNLGYAEADPSGDLNGTDTMYKLRLALAVGLETWINRESIEVSGIGSLKAIDIAFFKKNHWKLRLLCYGGSKNGSITAFVEPTLIHEEEREALIQTNNNLAWFETVDHHKTILSGQGAGRFPTATNIVRDLEMISEQPSWMLKQNIQSQDADNHTLIHAYYIRTDLSVASSFLEQVQSRTWVEGSYKLILTNGVSVTQLHRQMKTLSQYGEVFFAAIRSGETHESL